MRIPLIEYSSVKQKDGSRKTVSSYGPLSITQEDFTEIKELLRLIIQLKERSRNHCKNCKEKEEKGCTGCLWDQIGFHEESINLILRYTLSALGKEDAVETPEWVKKMEKERIRKLCRYWNAIAPIPVTLKGKIQPKWRIKNGSTK